MKRRMIFSPKTTLLLRQSVYPSGEMTTVPSVDPGAPARAGSTLGLFRVMLVSSKHRLILVSRVCGTGTYPTLKLILFYNLLFSVGALVFSETQLLTVNHSLVPQTSLSRFVPAIPPCCFLLPTFRNDPSRPPSRPFTTCDDPQS